MVKEMEKEKNIIRVNQNLKENILMVKDGTEKEKNIIIKEIQNLKENI